VDLFGFETEDSPEFSLTPIDKTPPAQANNKGLELKEDQLVLTWDLPQIKEVEGIHIYRQVGTDTNWTRLTKAPLPTSTRRYEDRVVQYGKVHAYAIGTMDKAGNENRTEAKILRVMDTKPPTLVRGLKAVADTGRITLTWFPNQDKDLAGYRIYRMMKIPGNTDTVLITPAPIRETEYRDVLPKVAKNEFVYFVAAEDSSYNQSPKGVAVRAVLPDPEPPMVPTLKTIRTEEEALKLVWLPSLDVDLAGYVLYRSEDEKAADTAWKAMTAKPLSPKDTTYSDRKIEAGKRYYYRLSALDDAGNESQKSSAFMGTITTIRLRTVPQDLEIKHKKGKPEATLTWTIAANPNIKGCMVYRKEAKGDYRPVSGLLTESQYTDKGLKKGSTYYYQVRAFDQVGNFAQSAPATLTIEAE
jgi:fibronectin type 3 domain-containing protein